MKLQELVRTNIKNLVAYSSARSEFETQNAIFLDANESPYGTYNRYPDPYQKILKKEISALKGIPAEQIFLGNGSDEVLDVLMRVFLEPHQDAILIFPPTYGMYEVLANINAINLHKIPLNNQFNLDLPAIEKFLYLHQPKMAILCSPNNPTGNILQGIETFLQMFKGIVVIDEAYIDFAEKNPSYVRYLNQYPNLVVSQTLSKAWGLAGLRIGMAFAQKMIIEYMNKVKYPYNISTVNQKKALRTLRKPQKTHKRIQKIISNRMYLEMVLPTFSFVKKIFPSDANFVLIEVTEANTLYQKLLSVPLVIRNRHSQIPNTLRITAGKKNEIDLLLYHLNKIEQEL